VKTVLRIATLTFSSGLLALAVAHGAGCTSTSTPANSPGQAQPEAGPAPPTDAARPTSSGESAKGTPGLPPAAYLTPTKAPPTSMWRAPAQQPPPAPRQAVPK
jgi:hypothetical protein